MSALESVERSSVSASVEPELKHGLAELARENERSEAAEVRIALRRHVDSHRAIALAAAGGAAAGDASSA